MAIELQQLTAADFQLPNSNGFLIYFPGNVTVAAEVEKVVELPNHANLERAPFSVLLQTTEQNNHYQQAIYTVVHPALGAMEIFLVPVGLNEKGLQYEAVFS